VAAGRRHLLQQPVRNRHGKHPAPLQLE
jgi:hypothetical protein